MRTVIGFRRKINVLILKHYKKNNKICCIFVIKIYVRLLICVCDKSTTTSTLLLLLLLYLTTWMDCWSHKIKSHIHIHFIWNKIVLLVKISLNEKKIIQIICCMNEALDQQIQFGEFTINVYTHIICMRIVSKSFFPNIVCVYLFYFILCI